MKTLGEYGARIEALLEALAIPPNLISDRTLVLQPEAQDLVLVEVDDEGRRQMLIPAAAKAWGSMRSAAEREGIVIKVASAFRSVDRQVEIVRQKIQSGSPLKEILAVVAPPGYSEHHTGCAIDITTDGAAPLEIEFEHTGAFRWLTANAAAHGFELSFPRNNRHGYQYEPWHWRFVEKKRVAV